MKKQEQNLSARMQAVYDLVKPCGVAADIGCDHGFVSIALAESGKASKVIAADINQGPLQGALANIRAAGLSDRIGTRLSDGLHNFNPADETDTIIIAGMGGPLVVKILEEGKPLLKDVKQLVLGPQSENFRVRRFLRENGFKIEEESFVMDGGKYYWIISAVPGREEEASEEIQKIYDDHSGYLIRKKDPLLKEYLEKSISVNEGYLKGIAPEKQGPLLQKLDELKTALKLME